MYRAHLEELQKRAEVMAMSEVMAKSFQASLLGQTEGFYELKLDRRLLKGLLKGLRFRV